MMGIFNIYRWAYSWKIHSMPLWAHANICACFLKWANVGFSDTHGCIRAWLYRLLQQHIRHGLQQQHSLGTFWPTILFPSIDLNWERQFWGRTSRIVGTTRCPSQPDAVINQEQPPSTTSSRGCDDGDARAAVSPIEQRKDANMRVQAGATGRGGGNDTVSCGL